MKTYCFGDSFISIFTVVKNCKVFKFPGTPAKGVVKKDNKKGLTIIKQISSLPQFVRDNACFIFQFGSVDVHISYFFKLLNDENFDPEDIEGFIYPIVDNYLNFIYSLPCKRKILLCPYFSPIRDDILLTKLIHWKASSEDVKPLEKYDHKYFSRKWRDNIVKTWCKYLIKTARGVNVIDIKEIIDSDKDKYRASLYNIHLLYEPVVRLYVKHLKECGVTENNIDFSKFNEYMKTIKYR